MLLNTLLCLGAVANGVLGRQVEDISVSVNAVSPLRVQISPVKGLLNKTLDAGRVVVIFAPAGEDPLDYSDVTMPGYFYGKNVYKFKKNDVVTLTGGSDNSVENGVYGFPEVSMRNIPAGNYSVQAWLNPYGTVTRSDGSIVTVHFPCGDGAPPLDGYGSLVTPITDVEVTGGAQTLALSFETINPAAAFVGKEIGGCSQGNYADTTLLKYVKIRSDKLSKFWGRDMYVGANVLLPAGYNANDTKTRYPVVYSQGHWPGGTGPFSYPRATFSAGWNNGTIPATATLPARPAPKLILVRFRHETPFYDDSYAVNTPNLGPYGDAIDEELVPTLDKMFNTIAQPYARIQEGGSTGGWESIAKLIFRPDLYGACFSSYPDSLDFHRHQAIPLYTNKNAYVNADGSVINSIRTFSSPTNNTEIILASTAQENHWELTQGTSSRSFLQWDVWQAVFGIQAYNNYPLEAWDKVTGEIYPEAVEFWKHMDLSAYVVANWNNSLNLGTALQGRVFIYVGTHDNYFLNLGVAEFQKNTDAAGGKPFANVTYLEGQPHGGNYQRRETWDYLEFLDKFIKDHAPNGTTPLSANATSPMTRGNKWKDVLAYGGRNAAIKRQAPPKILNKDPVKAGATVRASVGRWDPGVKLTGQWAVNGKIANAKMFALEQGQQVMYPLLDTNQTYSLALWVTGSKRNYDTEVRKSNAIKVSK